MTELFEPATLFKRLHSAGVRHVVVGGFAVIAHGVQRATADLDICPDPDPENLVRLASLLSDLDAKHAEAEDFSQDEIPYDPTDPKQLAHGGNFRLETVVQDAITADVEGVPVTVCSRSHLLSMKRAADRPIDRADLDQLGASPED